MLSDILVAADATKNEHGKFFNLIGAAVAFKSYHKFRDEYFEIVGEFINKLSCPFGTPMSMKMWLGCLKPHPIPIYTRDG